MSRPGRRRVGVLDLPWILMEARHPMHVAGVLVCRLPADASASFVPDLVRTMKRTAPSEPFDRRLHRRGLGRVWPWWESVAQVELDEHVRIDALDRPGTDRELAALVSQFHGEPLALTRPPWQLRFVTGLDERRFAIYAKFHHALVDGVGATRILLSALSADPMDRGRPPFWAPEAGDGHAASRGGERPRVGHLLGAARSAGRELLGAGTAAYRAPRTILNPAIGARRQVTTMTVDIARLRRVAGAIGGTINDVYLTACSSALRRYLDDAGALPHSPVVAAVPVSVRAPDGDRAGNAITFAFVPLPTDVEGAANRAAATIAATTIAKADLATVPRPAMAAYTVLTMAPVIAAQVLGLGARARPMFNLAVSNVPGPSDTQFYNGVELLGIHPVSLLQAGQALNVTALSCGGRLHITFTASPDALAGTHRLAHYVTDALDELEDAHEGPDTPARPAR
ncbi:Diacylglycerol O-acyltransferase [Jatrophihabitans endophyticus]|uniref:Diacylglycerol O-acyltransferase n=1 Tax=Jatrophihabitans endophyticus TaxID=1206085 RepID=A0A1M5KIK2_9ACTN|nr:wax ester/triacylglycerol synthase family O-acyltransferase [Jatrophihabitans endophyticus]SHG52581.1 Diacylglycerol O-acyltransferase [Jatrophihabitans endophyticus]